MPETNVLIVVNKKSEIEKVTTALSKKGFELNKLLPKYGIIMGYANDETWDELRTVSGVRSVTANDRPGAFGPPKFEPHVDGK